ncbi:hypothetical protein E3N88_43767 [Mikania micrantha]|uniref:Sialate O-acetylesterase domain-containing protein n=1 Tax=Mikania micrantha TaxID=192012 RepID=A0A5N6LDZ8_9ASTR|nr:hypothetical protein E3N88_43767 [Mikania micrantha]
MPKILNFMANNHGLKLTMFFLFVVTYEYWSSHVQPPDLTNKPAGSTHLIKDVFILAGQSNMAGRGGVIDNNWDGIIPPEIKSSPGKILRLGADLRWVDAQEPLHADIDVNKTCGVGPGMAFANAILRGGSRRFPVVGLVPCAIGGSGIEEWSRGGWLYEGLIRRAAAAAADGGGVALASGEGPYIEIVRKAQHEINLPNVMTVDAKGLLLQPDGLHLSTNAQVQVGKMLAHAMLRSIAG